MKNKYAFKESNKEHFAKAKINLAPVSTKHCIEICSYLRKKNLLKAKELLNLAIQGKKAIPFKRFTGDVGHRKGDMTSGRYIKKACSEILSLLNAVEANAQFKGINTSSLIITHLCANKASTPWKYGRQTRRKGKRTNVEIMVEEEAEKKAGKKKEEVEEKQEKSPELKKEPAEQKNDKNKSEEKISKEVKE